MAEFQSVVGLLLGYMLAIVIMLGGLTMIVGGPSLTGRFYGWLYRHLFLRPLRWALRQTGILLHRLLRWSGRQLWRLLVYLGRQFGRGVRYIWVRITT